MHVYMAAVYTNNYRPGGANYGRMNEREREIADGLPNILESFHYVGAQRYVDIMRQDGAKVFLDSGAFSAHFLKHAKPIDLGAYCEYIKRNPDIIREDDGVPLASVLDGIGDPLQTYRNQLDMEARGVRPLPCFHYGEDERYLEWYIRNYGYITIGGMVRKTKEQLVTWLDRIWDRYLTDGSGHARLKVHGFGLTTVDLMSRYPWYSCDSSSWIQAASFGSIVHAKHGPIAVSRKSPSRHDRGRHITSFTDIEKQALIEDFAKDGFTLQRLDEAYVARAGYNLMSYSSLGETLVGQRPVTKAQEFF